MHVLQSVLQFLIIFLALIAMYLLNCAKSAAAQPARSPESAAPASMGQRLRLILADWAFTTRWGRRAFALAIVLLLLNVMLSYLAVAHR